MFEAASKGCRVLAHSLFFPARTEQYVRAGAYFFVTTDKEIGDQWYGTSERGTLSSRGPKARSGEFKK